MESNLIKWKYCAASSSNPLSWSSCDNQRHVLEKWDCSYTERVMNALVVVAGGSPTPCINLKMLTGILKSLNASLLVSSLVHFNNGHLLSDFDWFNNNLCWMKPLWFTKRWLSKLLWQLYFWEEKNQLVLRGEFINMLQQVLSPREMQDNMKYMWYVRGCT